MSRLPLIGPLASWLGRSLTTKILLAFTFVVLVGVGGVAVLANDRTAAAFERYLQGSGPDFQGQLVNVVGTVYGQTGSWEAVSQVLTAMPGPPDQRIVVVGPSGAILVDARATASDQPLPSFSLIGGRPIVVNSVTVGTLFLPSLIVGQETPGGYQPGSPPVGLSLYDRAFLSQVNQSLLLVAIVAIIAASILGILLARQIIRPLRQLTLVAQRIAHGHLDERIEITGRDEVAQLGDAFNHMAESLRRTENARRQLVADVAHELRTPLMVVGATVEAMQDGVLPADTTNLATIRDEVASLSRLVSDLRDLSLGDVGQFSLENEPVDLADVLESVGSAFASAAAVHQINLAVDVTPELPWALGDEARLRQCARNLVENALRYTPAGGQVTVRGRARGDLVTIEVIDTGQGIKAKFLPYVFERFFRADESRDRRSGGSGLGLAIVRQIVQAHGGEISVVSDGAGRGSTFTMRIPALLSADVGPRAER